MSECKIELVYTKHAREASANRRLPLLPHLPPTAYLWKTDPVRGTSVYILKHYPRPICLVLADDDPGVVVTAFPAHI